MSRSLRGASLLAAGVSQVRKGGCPGIFGSARGPCTSVMPTAVALGLQTAHIDLLVGAAAEFSALSGAGALEAGRAAAERRMAY